MIKKLLLVIVVLAGIVAAVGWYKFRMPKTGFDTGFKFLYIRSNAANKQAVLDSVIGGNIVTSVNDFNWLAARMGYWEKIKPGRYRIKKGESIYDIVKKLRNGDHWAVDFVISRNLRTRGDFARLAGLHFEGDSTSFARFIFNADSLHAIGLDSTDWYTAILHNTYSMPWTYTPSKVMRKLKAESEKFWNADNRINKAQNLGYSPKKIYTIASIVAEETNRPEDKGNIASVYFNRLRLGMPLQADPTIRYALHDFKMNRVLFTHLAVNSPYNTYKNTGLPPGPITTVMGATIDAVLNAPKTDYIFFVADADLKGGSTFTSNLTDHNKAAKIYQDSLTAWLNRKAAKEKAKADSAGK